MISAFTNFIMYLGVSGCLLTAFIVVYTKMTPYNEFELMKQNNQASSITLAGAMLGFTFPMLASIYYTQSLIEMILWSCITGIVQLVLFFVARKFTCQIETDNKSQAIFMAALSICIGLLNAVSISH